MQAVRVKAMAMVEQAAGDALQALQHPSYPQQKPILVLAAGQVAILHTSAVYEAKARQEERFAAGARLLRRVAHRRRGDH